MFKKTTVSIAIGFFAMMGVVSKAYSAEAEIRGTVEAKCVIYVASNGIYGNPTPDVLSTATADGGAPAVIRYDAVNANYYKAVITTPTSFSTSPVLTDTVAWTGSAAVNQVTDAGMSAYDGAKREYSGNVTEFDLTIAGSVWFKVHSSASYGVNKAFPGGTYKSTVIAECIPL